MQHIHFGEQARHECPTLGRDDEDDDGFVGRSQGGRKASRHAAGHVHPMTSAPRTTTALLAGLLSLALAGCGEERPLESEPEFVHGSGGVHASVGEVLLRDVSIDEPGDTLYAAGDTARLQLTLFNEAEQPDALIGVTSPAASRSQLLVDRDCDGTAEVVGRIPMPAEPLLRTPSVTPPDGPEVNYRVDLLFDEPVRSGLTVPVTFTFEEAGSTTVQVPVEQTDQPLEQDVARCEPAA